jgi:cytochrome c-type biogenesis protein CcmE
VRLKKRQRLILAGIVVLLLGGASALVMTALQDSVAFFATPTDVATGKVAADRRFRIGGLVVPGSIEQVGEGGEVHFTVTDQANEVRVTYTGILPDLFREGQGIVAQGQIRPDGLFAASEVLAKHDENYMPPEAVEALKRAGAWQHDAEAATIGDGSP